MEIRMLRVEDAEAFRRLRLQALAEHPEAFSSSYEEQKDRTIEEWQNRLQPSPTGDHGYFGAFDGERLVGIVGFYRHNGEKLSHKASVISMYVDPAYRGKRLGERLMHTLMEHVRAVGGVEQLLLTVVSDNTAARRLYDRCGFVPYGEEKRALKVGDRYYDETLMVYVLQKNEGME
jgi:RimJ/RimL family protein N-acetyltransferase